MPRKEELARMTPEQRERVRAAARAWKKSNRDKANAANRKWEKGNRDKKNAARRRCYERNPAQGRYETHVRVARENARREAAAASEHAGRLAAVSERVSSQAAMGALYRCILGALPRRLPPAERTEAASVLFLSIMDGRRPIDFGPADVKAAVTEMDRFNEPLNSVSLSDDFGDRSRGEALGLF